MLIDGEDLTRCNNYQYCDKRNVCARTNLKGTRFYSYYRRGRECTAFVRVQGGKEK